MRISNGQGIAIAVFTACVVVACAADEPQVTVADVKPAPTKAPEAPGASTSPAPVATGNTPPDAGPATCAAHCTADSDCQSSCPAASQGGTNCCDTATGVCYAASAAACPPAVVDSGTPPPPY